MLFNKSIDKIGQLVGDVAFVQAYNSLRGDDRNYFENFLKSFVTYITGIHVNYYLNFWATNLDNYNIQYFNISLKWIIQLSDFPENEVMKSVIEFGIVISTKFYDQYFAQYQNQNSTQSNGGIKSNETQY